MIRNDQEYNYNVKIKESLCKSIEKKGVKIKET